MLISYVCNWIMINALSAIAITDFIEQLTVDMKKIPDSVTKFITWRNVQLRTENIDLGF